jgi:membrane-associated phospholipid phosphatase
MNRPSGTLRAMPASELPAATPSASSGGVATGVALAHAAMGGGWAALVLRVHALFLLKGVCISAFMWLFFFGYFHLLRYPARPPFEMPLTAVDRWVDFQAWALWPYISLWTYVVLPPALMPSARELIRYGWSIGGLCVVGLACFYWWPTAVPPQPPLGDAASAGFELLRGVDAAGNACPSLHVASATFSALWLDRLLRDLTLPRWLRAASGLWFALIVWSTLAVKQHVWWDVVAGLVLALAFAAPSLYRRGTARRDDKMALC